jgi:endogenous inhibitor of DNA gyrase (YacG/DUF329 family)
MDLDHDAAHVSRLGVRVRATLRDREVSPLSSVRPGETPGHTPTAGLRCPTCGRAIEWHGNPARPFCSLTCKLIDLGAWLDERVPGAPPADPAPPRTDEPGRPG